ncbi:protein javelin [Anopheles bellator]|uniref:protein javelin n=1 Tax=Anopheles bellator TaxID=139047 RepID=UPI00264964FC|nr:protein javelin [Anopheles bellator]
MPRPQVIQIVDSKHQQQHQQQLASNGADTVRKTSKNGQQTQREFLHKVDSVRNYWSKMLDEVDQQQLDEPDTKNDLRQQEAQELSGSKNGNAERKASIGSATSEASDSSKHTTSTKAASSSEGNIVRPAAVTSSRNKYPTYQLLDDEDGEDDLHCQSFSPTVEIIELDGHKQAALVKPKNAKDLDFDHVRYKVMKSEMFQKNLLVNHRKAAQFDGLMQYLQDYSFQELLAHNNVVIIEPVRTKIEKISDRTGGGVGGAGRSELPAGMCRITNGALQAASVAAAGKRLQHTVGGASVGLKKHFFYHPIRVNKELLDEELPSPDTVRNVRKLFEGTLRLGTAAKQAYEEAKANGTAAVGIRKWDSASLSSGVSSSGDLSSPCDCGEAGEHGTPAAVTDLLLHESHYVSQDVLEKIRECGSTVTYYGGRVLDKRTEHISTMTRAIMREIRGQDRKCGVCQPHNCVDIGDHDHDPDDDGVKFKLVKSNSCSSRLELAGTGKTPPDLLRPNGRMRGRHHIPEENGSGGPGSPIEEPEESVRDMVSRLESSGTLAPRSKPRIIESKCIEKGESPTADITINSQTTLDGVAVDHGDPGAVTPVTVNNHINHVHHGAPPPPPPLVIPPLLKAPGKVDQPPAVTAAAAAITSMERPTKVCRNKNVDLAFAATMRQIANLNGTTKSAASVRKSSSLVAIGAPEDGTSPPDSAPQSASSVTKTVTFNFTNNSVGPVNGSVESGAPQQQQQQQPLPVVDQSENLRPSAIAEQRKADELTSPKLVNWSTIGRFDERQYFANDRKLIEKRKYDDMEFEEFEVLDPNAPPSSEHYDSLNSK